MNHTLYKNESEILLISSKQSMQKSDIKNYKSESKYHLK